VSELGSSTDGSNGNPKARAVFLCWALSQPAGIDFQTAARLEIARIDDLPSRNPEHEALKALLCQVFTLERLTGAGRTIH
jgi:hypothetical protein